MKLCVINNLKVFDYIMKSEYVNFGNTDSYVALLFFEKIKNDDFISSVDH